MLAWRLADLHAGVPEESALVPDVAEPELAADAEVPADAAALALPEPPDDAALALPGPAGEAADDDDDAAQPAVRTATAISGMASSLFFTRSPV
jgi:hypothetical protein